MTKISILEPGTPEYDQFLKEINKKSPEQEELEKRILDTDISTPDFTTERLADWKEGLAVNSDPYGKAIYIFANEFAKNLETIMVDTGRPFNELSTQEIKQAEEEADKIVGGITGFMYGAAISTLSRTWKFGEDLKKWHNAQMGQPNAKGTVNPACLIIKGEA